MTQGDLSESKSVFSVAVIGAGISGMIAARTLVDRGLNVTVFEKSRGVGGRMATRRGENGSSYDHGAQYFTALDPLFRRFVETWLKQGLVSEWPVKALRNDQRIVVIKNGRIESESDSVKRFVGVPAMNSVCKAMGHGLEVVKRIRIVQIEQVVGHGLSLIDSEGVSVGSFDRLIVSAPAEQASELLCNFKVLQDQVSAIQMNPCWATMVTFREPISNDWAGAFLHDSFLSWASRNSTKPGRSGAVEDLVLHAVPAWTAKNWERDNASVAREMLDEFWRITGISPLSPERIQAHRWKYAIAVEPPSAPCFFDPTAGIAACGDWANGSRIEGAFLSGLAAANRVVDSLLGDDDNA